ncbi:MAG TPA: electron transfer flavoprotein subunit beta/FixA family protein [Actinomycetota bacterium]|nr:electron transfer flavoprotein subunit beta/FixA family protein [Actinomycetota bacterium]
MPLNIAVCVKRVPDTAAEKKLDDSDKTLDRESVESILNPVDEMAVEEALRLKESQEGEVTIISMGPEGAGPNAIRKALSMGADKGVHLKDDSLHGSDAQGVAYALSQVVKKGEYDIIFCGAESTDARTSLVPPALSEHLGLPNINFVKNVEVADGRVTAHRETDRGYDVVESPLPAVVGVVWGANEPRYPSFKGIMASKNKPVETLSAADAEVDGSKVGLEGSKTQVLEFGARSSERKKLIVDNKDGDAHVKLADFLQEQKFI